MQNLGALVRETAFVTFLMVLISRTQARVRFLSLQMERFRSIGKGSFLSQGLAFLMNSQACRVECGRCSISPIHFGAVHSAQSAS